MSVFVRWRTEKKNMTLEDPRSIRLESAHKGLFPIWAFVSQQITRVIRGLKDNKVHMLKFGITPTLKLDLGNRCFASIFSGKPTSFPLVWESDIEKATLWVNTTTWCTTVVVDFPLKSQLDYLLWEFYLVSIVYNTLESLKISYHPIFSCSYYNMFFLH